MDRQANLQVVLGLIFSNHLLTSINCGQFCQIIPQSSNSQILARPCQIEVSSEEVAEEGDKKHVIAWPLSYIGVKHPLTVISVYIC